MVLPDGTYGLGLTPLGNVRRPSTYKKRYPKLKRGRRRNANPHEIVWWMELGESKTLEPLEYRQYGVCLEYRHGIHGDRSYRVVRMSNPVSGHLYGRPKWVSAHLLKRREADPLGRKHIRGMKVVKANERIGSPKDRGCACMCCVHVAMLPSQVLDDGTYRWEKDNEDEIQGA